MAVLPHLSWPKPSAYPQQRARAVYTTWKIAGYRANLSMEELGYKTTVMVTFTLDRQTDGVMERFEQAIIDCPSVMWCYLMSGTSDYIACIMARDIADFERIHKEQLCRLPSVATLQSNFALRKIVQRSVPMSFG
jgi:Lrp/AsnC family leucine-responsive transcriptional regulator